MRHAVTAARSNVFRADADSVVVAAFIAIHRDGRSKFGLDPLPPTLNTKFVFHAVAPVNTSFSIVTLLQSHPVISRLNAVAL